MPGPRSRRYLAAIGGNQPKDNLQPLDVVLAGMREIAARGLRLSRNSALYRTPAFPAGSGPDFVNGAMAIETTLDPHQVIEIFHEIEKDMARERRARWASRTLDLDLIAAGDTILPSPDIWQHWYALPPERQRTETPGEVILPHPRLQDRAFVLVPMMDVAPEWRHPALGRTIAELCAELPQEERDSVVKLVDPPCV